ncbi:27 kDa hemolymph protein-like [Musca autumnalis]|uniref:27 kDa hemolymph protein-like n=1 Tax=Musca autumnalis TaxID=221902 RepID=UPI003CF4665D
MIAIRCLVSWLAVFAVLCSCSHNIASAAKTPELDLSNLSNINMNDLQSQLPGELPKTNLTLNDAISLAKDKCIKQAGEENGTKAYNEIETATTTLSECINGIINYTAIQEEIAIASPNGELDVVFNKYCLKRPEAMACIEAFNTKLTPCLDEEERNSQDVFMRIIRSLLNFVCHKGGDQIALFIAEKGPECLEANKEGIQTCINSTFSGYVPAEGIENVKTLPKLVMGAQQCEDIEQLEACIVKKLETCNDTTPANIAESMFRFIKNETICRTAKAHKQTGNSSGAVRNAGTLSLQAIFLLLFVQLVTYLKRKQIVV